MGRQFSVSTLAFATFGVVFCLPLQACDCQTAHVISMGVPYFGGIAMAPSIYAPMAQPERHSMERHSMGGHSMSTAHMEIPLTPVPPGTVGQTYSRPSHPVPFEEHPRTAMLAVRDDGSIPFLSVQNMGGIKMKSGVWLFESRRPLDPGVCQIMRVEARQTSADIEPYATRFVRLIPGRIVYLDF
jgi:hypothetical protein